MTDVLAGPAGAVSLAVLGAVCFAGAAVLQHRAVSAGAVAAGNDDGAESERLSLSGLRAVARQPGWLTGLALAGSGTALHAVALVLAPLSVVQPIGVLAVPIAVVLTALRSGRAPGRRVVSWVAMSVLGVAAFVLTSARTAVTSQPAAGAPLIAAVVVAGLVALLAAVGLTRTGWSRCIACATAGAVAFGLVSGLVRAVSQSIAPGLRGLLDPTVLVAVVIIGIAVLVGGWLVQQAFASGPPEVVVACLTVVDPIVAVVLGAVLLGEGAATGTTTWMVLSAAAAVAAAGVVGLAKHHPDAAGRPQPGAPALEPVRSRSARREPHFLHR
jgi:drug/metabolite transporter (DMT)-like permease